MRLFEAPGAIVAVTAPVPSTCAPANPPPTGAASYDVATKSSLPGGAGTLTVHVRGVPVGPPQAADPDEMSVAASPMMVLPPCAYALMSMPAVDGETNFGRRPLLWPVVLPPMTTETRTDCVVPAGTGPVAVGAWPADGVVPPPPLQPASSAKAAQAEVRSLRTRSCPSGKR